jgi:hypothetical protein
MSETYREENEINEAEQELRNAAILEKETRLQEDKEEHEHDREAEEESDYQDDEMIYN